MSTPKQKHSEKIRLSNVVKDWAGKNRKVFWKYEVSCFYQSYRIKVANLPNPSSKNITVSKNNRLLDERLKTQLCTAIEKAQVKADMLRDSSIDIQIDYVNGNVVTELV
jgi:hypothetical protein